MTTKEICPVCGIEQIDNDPTKFQKHVNSHLDDNELQKSIHLAQQLQAQQNEQTDQIEKNQKQDHAIARALQQSQSDQTILQTTKPGTLHAHLSDSTETFFPNILNRIKPLLEQTESFQLQDKHLCSSLDLFSSNIAGLGWDCGYRNIQMIFSSLFYQPKTASLLNQVDMLEVPSIPEIAGRIEDAWKRGFDTESAKSFGGSLIGKEVWIGAIEAYILLESLNIRATMHDFMTPTNVEKQEMYQWIFNHFNSHCNGKYCYAHQKRFSTQTNFVPPIFCQWQGHSITIVGAAKYKSGNIELIVLDPARSFYASVMQNTSEALTARRPLGHAQFEHPRFQLVTIVTEPSEPSPSLSPVTQSRKYKFWHSFCLKANT